MSIVNLNGLSVTHSSYTRASEVVRNKPEGSINTVDDVLESLRNMMPGWNITTSTDDWVEGNKNIQIDTSILKKMAESPEAMTAYKALIMDIADIAPEVEAWGKENPGQTLEFGVNVEADGSLTALAIVRTLMGEEISTTFSLPSDRESWPALIREKLNALSHGEVEDAYGVRSWLA